MTTTTLDLAEILEETDRLNQLLIHSQEVHHYLQCKRQLEQDPHAQALIRQFVKKKEEFEEVERFGRYHPDYQRVREEMYHIRRTMERNERVANFKKAERVLESILREIGEIIAGAVSDSIKVSTGNPFLDQIGCGGCSGRCSACGNNRH